jgi:hypothetical protein
MNMVVGIVVIHVRLGHGRMFRDMMAISGAPLATIQ